jgi:hypothetical protein
MALTPGSVVQISGAPSAGEQLVTELTYTAAQIDHATKDNIESVGAGGYSAASSVAVLADTWTDAPASFTIPYVSGFEYVSGSTIRYIGTEDHSFLFGGSCSLSSGTPVTLIQVALEVNGVLLAGSTTGPRYFSNQSDSGSLSYGIPITLSTNDTVGLVVYADKPQTIDINTWQSWAVRF